MFCIVSQSKGQYQLQIQLKAQSENIDLSEYPYFKANFRVLNAGQPVEVQLADVFISEGAFAIIPEELSPLINGWQEVKWYTKKSDPDDTLIFSTLMVKIDSKLVQGLLFGVYDLFHNVIITNENSIQIRDVKEGYWSIVQPGNSIPIQVRIRFSLLDENKRPIRMKLDSITTNTDIFKLKWLGSDSDPDFSEPPRLVMSGSSYWVNIYFEPKENRYYHDVMTIHYQGGLKKHLPLYGNSFKLDGQTLIELTEPPDGSKFTPCQTVFIRWKGHSVNLPTEISYTTNDGFTWTTIDNVMGNEYLWTVPDIETERLRLRIKQNFKQADEYILSEDNRPVFSVGYDTEGTKLTSSNITGKLLTWDLTKPGQPTIMNRAYIGESDESQQFYSFGLVYNNTKTEYIVGYRSWSIPFIQRRDSLAFFKMGEQSAYRKIQLPTDFISKKIITNITYNIIAVLPLNGTEMLLYSSIDGTFLRSVKFDAPLMDFAYNGDGTGIALLFNNQIKIVELSNYNVIDEISFDYFLNSVAISMSPDGRLIGLGNKSDGNGLKTDIFVIDLQTKEIAKVYGPSIGDPIRIYFNPTSTSLIVGSTQDKQIAFYDLTQTKKAETLFGHFDEMTDMQISPNGHSLASTATSRDNLMYRVFTYPEEFITGNMIIRKQELTNDTVRIPFAFLGTENQHVITQICNPTDVMIILSEGFFEYKSHLNLEFDWMRDTLFPGECLEIVVNFNPLDTGVIRDNLIFKTCNTYIRVPFSTYSYPRNVTYFNKPFEMGEVCIGDTVIYQRELFRNDDPVPLFVNFSATEPIANKEFKDETFVKDTLIPPGGSYFAKIRFTPLELGLREAEIAVYHSNQSKIKILNEVRGIGIGSFIETSHTKLLFIPEIDTRELRLHNVGKTDIVFDGFDVVPVGLYQVLTPTPFTLKPDETAIIEITKLTEIAGNASLIIDANPCLIQRFIPLGPYTSSVILSLPIVEVEATDTDVEIPITVSITEQESYKGIRNFEGEFEVHAGLFLPLEVSSEWGDATLTRNTIEGNIRTIGFRIDGDFPTFGILGVVKGVAGIAETDNSDLVFTTGKPFFGASTSRIETENGKLIIIGLCEDRRIIRSYDNLSNVIINPNPANNQIQLDFDANFTGIADIEIADFMGNIVNRIAAISVSEGLNSVNFDVSSISSGLYTIRILSNNIISTQSLIISR